MFNAPCALKHDEHAVAVSKHQKTYRGSVLCESGRNGAGKRFHGDDCQVPRPQSTDRLPHEIIRCADQYALVRTRGPNFPLSSLDGRLICPRCRSRRVVVMFQPPTTANAARR